MLICLIELFQRKLSEVGLEVSNSDAGPFVPIEANSTRTELYSDECKVKN